MGKKKETIAENEQQQVAVDERKGLGERSTGYSWLQELRYGRSISVEFFKHNAWLLLIIIVAVIALIGLRYQTKTKMVEIKRLNRELSKAESNKLQEKSAYMSLIRETEMRKMVRDKGLPLEFQEQPPYEIIDK